MHEKCYVNYCNYLTGHSCIFFYVSETAVSIFMCVCYRQGKWWLNDVKMVYIIVCR